MILICQVDGPVFGDEVHQEKPLAYQKDDGKEKEERFPNPRSEGEARVRALALVPQFCPTVEGYETPQRIKKRKDHKADGLASVE